MTAPWNVRVAGKWLVWPPQKLSTAPDYYLVATKQHGEWRDAGVGSTWFEAFLMGLVA